MAREGIRIVAGPEFTRVANALRVIDNTLPTKFRKDIRNKVKPWVSEVKQRAKTLPTPQRAGHTGLRRRVARGVGVQAKVGANPGVRIVTRMAKPEEKTIPRGLDSMSWRNLGGGWFHPVFDRPNTKVFQKGYSWFVEPLGEKHDDMRRALIEVLDDAAESVARQGGRIPRL